MKIISNFTDFYEFDAYRYGEPDKRLVWVRNTESFEIRRHNDKNTLEYFSSKAEFDDFNKLIKSLFLPQSVTTPGYYNKNNGRQNILIIYESLIGIYPYVYYCPVLLRKNNYNTGYFGIKQNYVYRDGYESEIEVFPFPLTEDDYRSKKGIREKIARLCPGIGSIDGPNIIFPPEKKPYLLSYLHSGKHRINNDPFKTECKRLFEILGVPIFKINYHEYFNNEYGHPCIQIEKNTNLLNTNLLKCHPNVQNEHDIYNDIENFLREHKQEPISELPNDLKIQSAGFDKKTSFRKM